MKGNNKLNLTQLAQEFADFQPDAQFSAMDGEPFLNAMADPEPEFVTSFVLARQRRNITKESIIRDLYAFLLDKRYYSRSNLLYFAFDVFCSRVSLPDEVLEMTPLPHEEGTPLFKYKLVPGFKVE